MTQTATPADGTTPVDAPATGTRPALAANLLSLVPVALALGAYLLVSLRHQLQAGDALRAYASIAFAQVLPGALVWRTVRPRDGWLLEDLGVGFAIGSALAVPTAVVAGLTGVRPLAWVLPLLLAAVLLAVPGTRRRVSGARWTALPWWLPVVVAVVSLAPLTQFRSFVNESRLTWPVPGRPHMDLSLHQALASEILNRGPVAWPTVLGEDLGYHWFAHAWMAHVTAASGVDLDVVLLRVLPAFMPLAVALAVAVAVLRMSGRAWVAAVATVLTLCGGAAGFLGTGELGLPLTPWSPTLALGAPTLLTLVTVLGLRWRGEMLRGAFWLVPLLAVVAAGTKGSTVPLVVAGLGLTLVACLLWNRALVRAVLLDLLVTAAALVAVMVVVFHGSSAGLALSLRGAAAHAPVSYLVKEPLTSGALLVLALVTAVAAGLARAGLALVLPADRATRTDPFTWLLVGAALAGAGAVGIFTHPGRSEYYFLLTAIPLAAWASASGLQVLAERLPRRTLLSVLGAGGVAGVLALLAPRVVGAVDESDPATLWLPVAVSFAALLLGGVAGLLLLRGRRGTGFAAGLGAGAVALGLAGFVTAWTPTPQPFHPAPDLAWPLATSQGQIDAARWIRAHSGVDDLVMTNRHCITPRSPFGGCDSRRWLVTAFSERQALVEGWTATPRATEIAPHGRDSITVDYWKPDILRLNDGFYTAPSAEARKRLWDLGVRWVYMENTVKHAPTLAPYAVRRFVDDDASAWQLLPPR